MDIQDQGLKDGEDGETLEAHKKDLFFSLI